MVRYTSTMPPFQSYQVHTHNKGWTYALLRNDPLPWRCLEYHGVVWKPSYAHYYTENAIFATPVISKILSYNRFLFIKKFLHFVANRTLGENYEKIAKIKPVHDYLSQPLSLLYTPKRGISIGKSLLLWKGLLFWKQYIPKKHSHFGMKSFALC